MVPDMSTISILYFPSSWVCFLASGLADSISPRDMKAQPWQRKNSAIKIRMILFIWLSAGLIIDLMQRGFPFLIFSYNGYRMKSRYQRDMNIIAISGRGRNVTEGYLEMEKIRD
ncbi:hypothetical protein PITCH_A350047 [uncultured Desulfobacterium sp.]|uniref:Uncharacterized protein n=1 Tax=uncultured Desulfobacterium sp. TaxID=201089 RepID=A0A445MZC0_9BACT|nr:hypothetical protein PITCH_A350047 [uncultured Desulfobacterium sp.]